MFSFHFHTNDTTDWCNPPTAVAMFVTAMFLIKSIVIFSTTTESSRLFESKRNVLLTMPPSRRTINHDIRVLHSAAESTPDQDEEISGIKDIVELIERGD